METIGDAYMIASGVPVSNGTKHAVEIALVSLNLLAKVLTFEINHKPGYRLKLRMGIHSGSVVGGVVVGGTGIAAALQELVGGGDVAEEGRPALGHEENLVEHLYDLTAGLVDGADDGSALACQSAQGLHHRGRHVAVQPRGGLVTEHDAGVGEDLTGQ